MHIFWNVAFAVQNKNNFEIWNHVHLPMQQLEWKKIHFLAVSAQNTHSHVTCRMPYSYIYIVIENTLSNSCHDTDTVSYKGLDRSTTCMSKYQCFIYPAKKNNSWNRNNAISLRHYNHIFKWCIMFEVSDYFITLTACSSILSNILFCVNIHFPIGSIAQQNTAPLIGVVTLMYNKISHWWACDSNDSVTW